MVDNKEENENKERLTVYISSDLKEWIRTKAEKERRNTSAMAAILLEDAQNAEKGFL